jgi:hypothetical protein
MQQLYCQSSRKWYDLAPLFTRTNGVPTDRDNPNLVYNMRQSNPFWRQAISENNSCFESQKGLETVNHSVNFVDPSTGVHTQSIESYWTKTKYKFKVMKGVRSNALPSYLDERMWRDRWRTTTKDAFYNLCRHISEQYPF